MRTHVPPAEERSGGPAHLGIGAGHARVADAVEQVRHLRLSVSFEWDYTNVLTLLRLAGIPLRAADRTAHDPIVMIGGAVTFVNPEPLALFADIIAAGEGERSSRSRAGLSKATDRSDMLRRLVSERGFYVPAFYDVRYADDGTIEAFVTRRNSATGGAAASHH